MEWIFDIGNVMGLFFHWALLIGSGLIVIFVTRSRFKNKNHKVAKYFIITLLRLIC